MLTEVQKVQVRFCVPAYITPSTVLGKVTQTRTIISSGLQFTHCVAWKYLSSLCKNADFTCFYFLLMTSKAVFALALKRDCQLMEIVEKDS